MQESSGWGRRGTGAVALWLIAGAVEAQVPGTDVYLADLAVRGGVPAMTGARNITLRAGYDNQPQFTADGRTVLYTVIGDDGQADIWRIDVATSGRERVTRTSPESEYSATPAPGGGFTVIRVERDSAQRLWRFGMDGSGGEVLLPEVRPVGYHAWADAEHVVMFVLGTPATLQLGNVRTGAVTTHASAIGRSLQRVPGRRAVSFAQRIEEAGGPAFEIHELDVETRAVRRIAAAPSAEEGVAPAEFHAWTPDGTLLIAHGSRILWWDADSRSWRVAADWSAEGLVLSRLAVSPVGDRLAFVAERRQRQSAAALGGAAMRSR